MSFLFNAATSICWGYFLSNAWVTGSQMDLTMALVGSGCFLGYVIFTSLEKIR